MPDNYLGQVQMSVIGAVDDRESWTDVVESDDKEFVLHCLRYHKYKDMPQRIVRIVTYVVQPLS